MDNRVIATPKTGVLVRHENGRLLEAGGELVERNAFWLRRERDGDVTLAPEPAPPATKPTKT